ncbi:MAG: hypothetical protein ACI9LE_000600 [Paraglaciecola sp.]|jgi:hypothetical protein
MASPVTKAYLARLSCKVVKSAVSNKEVLYSFKAKANSGDKVSSICDNQEANNDVAENAHISADLLT